MAGRGAGEGSGAWPQLLAAALTGAAAALAVSLGLGPARPAPQPADQPPPATRPEGPAPDAGEVAALREELRRERDSRRALAFEVAQLRTTIEDELRSAMALADDAEPETREGGDDPRPDPGDPAGQGGFDASLLAETGMHPTDVDRLRERWASLELAKLEIQDQALREGWLFTPRQRSAIRDLEEELRADLGEKLYDAYLYATGSPNHVVVRQIVPRSAAAEAGLQPGDVILRYDEQRIYQPGELRRATSSGVRGERVAVEILRNGRREVVGLRRGPMGVLLDRRLEPPAGS